MARESVKLLHGALDEKQGDIVLRGVLDTDSFKLLQVASYQREVMPYSRISELVAALKSSKVPDIELGMRGGDYHEREGIFYLQNDIYIIDGLQRVSAGMQMLMEGGEQKPRLGATIHFNTSEEWERERFKVLNVSRTKVSPNVLLRNLCPEIEAIALLHTMSTKDPGFILHSRVSWDQRIQRTQIISALTLLKVTGMLHAHIGPGRGGDYHELAEGSQKIFDRVGRNTFRDNVKTFFEIVDECWGVRAIAFKEGATYMRATFLGSLARLFSSHLNFWRDRKFVVEKDLRRKLSTFPVSDPTVRQLSGASGQARSMLLTMMIQHINSGKRTHRLQPRDESTLFSVETEEDGETAEMSAGGK
ncbi:MAG: hypothetical protein Q8R07_03810 [Candidatus Uhrbacteria bacterium]|nr:hypothetical protein [Candidatus Uhrbacteria bacterium]